MRALLNFVGKSLGMLALLGALAGGSLRAEIIYWPSPGLDAAKEGATSLQCLNHLKQIVLAAHAWSSDHADNFPASFQVFTNELGSPEPLVCPANVAHPASTNWMDFDWGQSDYDWLPQTDWLHGAEICCRCRVHNNVARVDGTAEELGGYHSGWPAVAAAPLGQYASPGSEVRFEVTPVSDALRPLTFQWQREQLFYVTNVTFVADPENPGGGHWTTNRRANFTSTALSGQTNASYVIAAAQTNHSDYYRVVISNALGAAASSRAQLYVDSSVAALATNNYWSAINCVNNLRQMALLAREWAAEHADQLPTSFATLTNAFGQSLFGWPVALHCRYDSARTVPADWSAVNLSDTSYEMLPLEADPAAAYCRCKVHGFYARTDGSVIWQPQITGIKRLADHTTELSVTVFAGLTHSVEVSTDFRNWTALSNGFPAAGAQLFYETNQSTQQFYRIRGQ